MAGSITTLGIGSGLDLQNILDQLKEAEQAPITSKENEKTKLQKEISAYNSVNTKLFSMKSDALSLSLESDFLKNNVSISDEDVLTATANDGIAQSSHTIDVTQKAQYSSFQTVGVESADSVILSAPTTGIESATETVTSESSTMTILYGSLDDQQSIEIDLTAGMSLTNIIDTVNASDANQNEDGEQLVMASIGNNDGEYYIRFAAASGGDSVDSQISVADYDYVMSDTTVSIATAGVDDPMYLSIAPGTTYTQMATSINSATDNPGVTASIVDTGTAENPFRLTLTSKATGENNRISLSENLPMTEVTGEEEGESLNAIFKVNGVEYQRQSNAAITDVISGVTLNLKKVGETSIGIQNNLDPVKENILSLIEGFNDLIADINGSSTEDSSDTETETDETENPLSSSFDVKNMISSLKVLISSSINTESEYISLADLGLEINRDGTMSLDEVILEQALAADPDAVQSLFIGDSDAEIIGLGDIINNGITSMISSQGIVSTEIDAAETRIARLDRDILSATERLDKRYKTMTAQFVRLDTYISRLNNESAFMQSMIESFNKTTE